MNLLPLPLLPLLLALGGLLPRLLRLPGLLPRPLLGLLLGTLLLLRLGGLLRAALGLGLAPRGVCRRGQPEHQSQRSGRVQVCISSLPNVMDRRSPRIALGIPRHL
jgi:hypothetical protein